MSTGNRRKGVAWWCGWGGLLLVAALGATSGISGVLIFAGMYALIVAIVALVRGRVSWALLRGRGTAAVALAAGFGLLATGAAMAGPATTAASTPTPSTGTSTTPPASTSTAASVAPSPASSTSSSSSPAPESTASSTSLSPEVVAQHAPAGTALAAVADLTVKGRAAKTGYDRAAFGQAWFDADRNGCDTRNDILRHDLTGRSMKNWCKVLAGTLVKDPYTGRSIRFVYRGASEVDIDHVVAVGDAWQKGALTWPYGKKIAFANDPANLLAVDAGANRAKGDGDAATWLPPNKSYRCGYVARQVMVKKKYGLWVTPAERDAMVRVLSKCDGVTLPGRGTAPTSAQPPRTRTPAPKKTTAPPVAPPPPAVPVYYANCAAVRAAGAAPIYRGQPGYSSKLDRDGDGVACE